MLLDQFSRFTLSSCIDCVTLDILCDISVHFLYFEDQLMYVKYLVLDGHPEIVAGMTVINTVIPAKCYSLFRKHWSYSPCSLTSHNAPPAQPKNAVVGGNSCFTKEEPEGNSHLQGPCQIRGTSRWNIKQNFRPSPEISNCLKC